MTDEELRIKYLGAVADYEYEKAKNSEAIHYLAEEMAKFYGKGEFKSLSTLAYVVEILKGGNKAEKSEEEFASLEKRELLEVIDYLQTERKYWMTQFANCNNNMVSSLKRGKQLKEEFEDYLRGMLDRDDDIFSVVRVKEVLDVYEKLESGNDE